MICDKCIKKTVCKLCDGSEIKGCIEFYRTHEEVLKEIRQEIDEYLYANEFGSEYRSDVAKIIDKYIEGMK